MRGRARHYGGRPRRQYILGVTLMPNATTGTGVEVLKTQAIGKRFPGTMALHEVSVSFYGGEVHAVMGENGAGKSTLLKVLTGVFPPDEGHIVFQGAQRTFRSPADARAAGISIVHQELSLFPHLTVMENILHAHMPQQFGLVKRQRMRTLAREYLQVFDVTFPVDQLVRELSVAQQQIVEIVKSLVVDAHLYIFDEPTATLSNQDVERLFKVIRRLKADGKSIAYVSHKFSEIFQIADRITVLRDGHLISTNPASELDATTVIKMMVGRALNNEVSRHADTSGPVQLEVSHLMAGKKCVDVSFRLHQGEILGVFGLVGSGRTEMMRALVGADRRQSGQFKIEGAQTNLHSVQDAIRHGVCYVTEDRKSQGLFLKLAIADNLAVTQLKRVSRGGLVRRRRLYQLGAKLAEQFRIKMSNLGQRVNHLSGGNQQKVLIGKWVSLNPRVLILDEPTRGIDVGAKAEIHVLLRQLADDGIGIIMISSELPEIIHVSDRVLVVHNGRIVADLRHSEVTEERIMSYASGLGDYQGGDLHHG